MDIPAGGSTSVGADPGPQLFFVQRGSGNATTHSSFAWPPVSDGTACLRSRCLHPWWAASLQCISSAGGREQSVLPLQSSCTLPAPLSAMVADGLPAQSLLQTSSPQTCLQQRA